MKFQIEIQHHSMERVRLIVGDHQLCDQATGAVWSHDIHVHAPQTVQIWFWPWDTKPLLRVNGHLLDYSLAGVHQYSHMLTMALDKKFFERYFQNLVRSRIDTLFPLGDIDDELYDGMVGHGDRHRSLIDSIQIQLK
jgi:hypothetical protein